MVDALVSPWDTPRHAPWLVLGLGIAHGFFHGTPYVSAVVFGNFSYRGLLHGIHLGIPRCMHAMVSWRFPVYAEGSWDVPCVLPLNILTMVHYMCHGATMDTPMSFEKSTGPPMGCPMDVTMNIYSTMAYPMDGCIPRMCHMGTCTIRLTGHGNHCVIFREKMPWVTMVYHETFLCGLTHG